MEGIVSPGVGGAGEMKEEAKKSSVLIRCTDGTSIEGKVTLSEVRRVSDLLNKGKDPFIIVTDASMGGGSGQTIFINKNHIVSVRPKDPIE